MAPEVLIRKLHYLRQLLADLENYRTATQEKVEQDHYVVERILELLVVVACDIVTHLLAERQIQVESYRDAFETAGKEGLISPDLAASLADAAGMRNIIVHLYEAISYSLLHAAIPLALDDFAAFVRQGATLLPESEETDE